MKNLDVSANLKEKIFDVKFPIGGTRGYITTYFPLTPAEKQDLKTAIGQSATVDFKSIFSDVISDLDWNSTKEQIKKKFQDELIDLD